MMRTWLHDILASRFPGHPFDILVPPDPSMGDFSTNVAMALAKRENKDPRNAAAEVCAALEAADDGRLARCEAAGPGFVNIFLADDWLRGTLRQHDVPREGHGRTVIVEYSAPNIAKPMHVGHLRSTIIGDALANTYAALGYTTVRWNYLGDWGTQFGKLLAAFKRYGGPATTVAELVRLYVRFHADMKDDPSLEEAGRAEFRKLEEGDAENRALWARFRDLSLAEYQRTYALLGVRFDVYKGESEYEPALAPLIARLEESGLAVASEGALVVDLEAFGLPPGLVRKSDKATLYLTRDIASLEDRIADYRPEKALYVVANEQALHFEQLFAVAQRMQLTPLPELIHVKFGLVLGPDGKKFSTREGNAVPLQDIIDEAVRRAAGVVRAKNPEMPAARADEVAQAVALGALKYNDLRQHPHTDIVFDWDAMLSLAGNSGPYLQYTHARLAGILAKAGERRAPDRGTLVHPAERALLRHLVDYGWAVAQCARLHALSGLALYLYQLATLANGFYEQVRVNDDDNAARKAARLELVDEVRRVLGEGLELLGIRALERI